MPIDFHIVEVPVGHGWALESLANLSSEISIETYGEDRTISLAPYATSTLTSGTGSGAS